MDNRFQLELVTLVTAVVYLVAPGESFLLSGRMENLLDWGSRRTGLVTFALDNQSFISHWDRFLQHSCINRQTVPRPLNGKPIILVNGVLSQGYTTCLCSVCQSLGQHRHFHADRLCCGFVFPGLSTACPLENSH